MGHNPPLLDEPGAPLWAETRPPNRVSTSDFRPSSRPDRCLTREFGNDAVSTEDGKGWLFRTSRGHDSTVLSEKPMGQPDAWRMIRKRAAAAGIAEEICCHTFRATGITAYLANGGALEHAQEMAAHESPRTTKLYDRTKERLTQDEVERIRL
jgi:integrase